MLEQKQEQEILEPWMRKNEINLIKSYLGKDKVVLEWGSGGSTIEFSKHVKKYYSIEHDFDWYQKVFKNIGENVKLYYVPPNFIEPNWVPARELEKYEDSRSYIEFISNIGSFGKKFDIVLVDGRARAYCAIAALPYLLDDAIVFMHDFEEVCYWKVLKYYEVAALADKIVALKKKKETFNTDKIFLAKEILLKELKEICLIESPNFSSF